jgi:hypothetical protein
MKLIMENFRKTMKEGWPGAKQVDAPWTGKPNHDWSAEIEKKKMFDAKEIMKDNVAATVRDEILADFDNKHTKISDIVDDPSTELDTGKLKRKIRRYLGDEIAANGGPAIATFVEDDYNDIVDKMDTFGEDEEPEEMSDMEDPPGPMPGEGGNY